MGLDLLLEALAMPRPKTADWPLSAPRVDTKAPYKPDVRWETLRVLNSPAWARTDSWRRGTARAENRWSAVKRPTRRYKSTIQTEGEDGKEGDPGS